MKMVVLTCARLFKFSLMCGVFVTFLGASVIAAEEQEKVNKLTTVAIIFAENNPNALEKGTSRGKLKALFKQFDSVPDSALSDASNNKKADKIAFKYGLGNLPPAMFSTVIDGLKGFGVEARPLFYSSLRIKSQMEDVREDLYKLYTKPDKTEDFVLTILPYQTIVQDRRNVMVWFGLLLYDKKTKKNKVLNYLHVPFGRDHIDFGKEEAAKFASVLIEDLKQRGYILDDMKEK